MHREAFTKTKKYFGISGKKLHQQTGVSANHISEFLNGKKTVSSDLLDRLVEGMEEIEPGAKQFYATQMLGYNRQALANVEPEILVDAMDNEQISKLMFAIAAKMDKSNKTNRQPENEQLTVSY